MPFTDNGEEVFNGQGLAVSAAVAASGIRIAVEFVRIGAVEDFHCEFAIFLQLLGERVG